MDRLLLTLSTLAFVGALVHAIVALRAGTWKDNKGQWVLMALALALQSGFLYLRGEVHGRCPLTNLFEVFIFIGWSMVLLYFLVGATYRLSLLGLFTAPMVALLQTLALLSSLDTASPKARSLPNAWLELHAAISLIAYAAFALGCVTGVMYLMQERMLKRHKIHALFFQLPPIHELARAIQRLVLLGLVLLSLGLAAAYPLHIPISNPKMIFTWCVWGMYALIAVVMWRHILSARQTAWLAVVGFLVPLVSLWIVTKA